MARRLIKPARAGKKPELECYMKNTFSATTSYLPNAFLAFLAILLCFNFLLSAISLSNAAALPAESAITVKPEPTSIPPGGVSLVRISVPQGATVTAIRYLKKNFPVFRQKGDNWFAIIGAGLKTSPGRHNLTVKWKQADQQEIYASVLPIIRKKYPEEHLKVSRKMVNFPPDILKRVLDDQKAVRGACSRISKERYWQGSFIWPVNSKVLSPFGLRRFFNGQPRSPHSGVDLRAKDGTPIVAPNNGVVVLARDCYLSGKTVVIDHGAGLYTLYAHFSKFKVKTGDKVKKGQVIGLAGSTGRVTGPHLHWGVSLLGTRIDPQQFMEVAEKL